MNRKRVLLIEKETDKPVDSLKKVDIVPTFRRSGEKKTKKCQPAL